MASEAIHHFDHGERRAGFGRGQETTGSGVGGHGVKFRRDNHFLTGASNLEIHAVAGIIELEHRIEFHAAKHLRVTDGQNHVAALQSGLGGRGVR